MQESLKKTSIDNKDILNLYYEGLKQVEKIVNLFNYRYRILDKDELKSHLTEKLVLVIRKFDPSKGIAFKFFAIPSLRGYAWNFIRDHGRPVKVPRKYCELYMRYNSLNRKNDYKLTIPDAAVLMEVPEPLLRSALEAANLKFSEITGFNSTLICEKSDELATAYIMSLPINIREMLEDIYLDNRPEEEVFLKRGLSPLMGRRLLQKYLDEIFKLKT